MIHETVLTTLVVDPLAEGRIRLIVLGRDSAVVVFPLKFFEFFESEKDEL